MITKVGVREFSHSHWKLLLRTSQNFQQTLTMKDDGIRHNGYFRSGTHITTLKSGKILNPYDDLNCLEDLRRVGFLQQSTNVWPYAYTLTERGGEVAQQLKDYLDSGGTYETFAILNLKIIGEIKGSFNEILEDIGPS